MLHAFNEMLPTRAPGRHAGRTVWRVTVTGRLACRPRGKSEVLALRGSQEAVPRPSRDTDAPDSFAAADKDSCDFRDRFLAERHPGDEAE